MSTAVWKKDFPDWLSPMWVKELRQGLRGPGFIWIFLLLQSAMVIMVLAALLGQESGVGGDISGGIFWTCMTIGLLFIFPLMSFNSVSREISGNTLELVLMSRLSPRAVLAGKWLSLFSQAALLVVTVLPYLIIRYFAGGVDLIAELTWLLTMLAASGLLMAIGMGLSPYLGRIMRILLPIGLLFFLWGGFPAIVGILFGASMMGVALHGGTLWPTMTLAAWLPLTGMAVITGLLAMEMGAAKIAPQAQNHSTLVRIYGVVILLLMFVGYGGGDILYFTTLAFGGVLLFLICSLLLMEEATPVPGVLVPFIKRGPVVRWLGRIFAPGAHTGLVYTVLILLASTPLWFGALISITTRNQPGVLFVGINLICLIFFGPALAGLVQRWIPNRLAVFVGQILLQALFGVFLVTLATIKSELDFTFLAAPFPLSDLMMAHHVGWGGATAQFVGHTVVSVAVLGLCILYLAIRSVRLYRRQFALEKRAMEELKTLRG